MTSATNKIKKPLIIGLVLVFLAIVGGIITWRYIESNNQRTDSSDSNSSKSAISVAPDDSDDIDWSSLPTTTVSLTDDGLEVTEAGTYVLSGSSTGQVVVASDGYVRLVFDGVEIRSSVGAAIDIESAKKTVLQLANDSSNTVSDSSERSNEDIDGAIYSADDLVINGRGSLAVSANFADGIVGKDDLWINTGNISVSSMDDGIRGKDSLNISGGIIVIDAKGDGMKASNDTDEGKGQIVITGGDITISSGDDAIKAEQKISISGGTINIKTSVEGIEAPVIVIDDGDITLYASDDGINASASAIITSGLSITINGGQLNITVGPGDTDGIDSNGNLYINGGEVTITAQMSSLDFDGNGSISDDSVVIVNGSRITEMPAQMGGGGMMGGARG